MWRALIVAALMLCITAACACATTPLTGSARSLYWDGAAWLIGTDGSGSGGLLNTQIIRTANLSTYTGSNVFGSLGSGHFVSGISSDGAGHYVAVTNNGRVATSSDGISWSLGSTISGVGILSALAYFGGSFIAVGENTGFPLKSEAWISTDNGATWAPNEIGSSTGEPALAVAVGAVSGTNRFLVSVQTTGFFVSAAGTTWISSSGTGIAAPGSVFCAPGVSWVVGAITASAKTATSATAASGSWTTGSSTTGLGISKGISYSAGLARYVQVGAPTTAGGAPALFYSSDGRAWISTTGPFTNIVNAVSYDGSANFVAVASDGVIGKSTDGIVWVDVSPYATSGSPNTNFLFGG